MHVTPRAGSDYKTTNTHNALVLYTRRKRAHGYTVTGGGGVRAHLKHVQYEGMWSVKGREVWHYPQSPTLAPTWAPPAHLSVLALQSKCTRPPTAWLAFALSHTHTRVRAATTHCDPLHLPWHGDSTEIVILFCLKSIKLQGKHRMHSLKM